MKMQFYYYNTINIVFNFSANSTTTNADLFNNDDRVWNNFPTYLNRTQEFMASCQSHFGNIFSTIEKNVTINITYNYSYTDADGEVTSDSENSVFQYIE